MRRSRCAHRDSLSCHKQVHACALACPCTCILMLHKLCVHACAQLGARLDIHTLRDTQKTYAGVSARIYVHRLCAHGRTRVCTHACTLMLAHARVHSISSSSIDCEGPLYQGPNTAQLQALAYIAWPCTASCACVRALVQVCACGCGRRWRRSSLRSSSADASSSSSSSSSRPRGRARPAKALRNARRRCVWA